jgi:DNA-directed RNA polymerase specialized sigma24 family protein
MTKPPTYTDTELWAIAQQVLTAKQLHVCRLLWLRGFSIRRTAQLLDIAPSTVTDHERAAKRRLAKATPRKAAA